MQTVIYIYGLLDPRDKRVRYVGKTNNLKRRYEQHLSNYDASNPHKQNWIEQLKRNGLRPEMVLIEECEASNWIEREVYSIAEYRQADSDLVNIGEGGEGYACEASRIAWIKAFAKFHKVPLTECFVCKSATVSSIGICSRCLREIDENYKESAWYRFLIDDHEKTHQVDKRDKKRLVLLNA